MQNFILYIFIVLYCTSSLLSITLSPCAKWNITATTLAGGGLPGHNASQLNYPDGIFIHEKLKRLYISDSLNNRVQVFPLDQSTVIGLTVIPHVNTCTKIYVGSNNGNRVGKWTKDSTQGAQVGSSCRGCTGVWLDQDKNVYISDHKRHCIYKWSPLTNISTIVAGELDMSGPREDHLTEPRGIMIGQITDAVYIADVGNHRIQKWPKNSLEGVTVAGSSDGTPGSDSSSLNSPHGLFVDEETKIVYVADTSNHRIVRWQHGETEGDTIAGGNGRGKASNQLHDPFDLSFDNNGNLFVSDSNNHRVQFFNLIDNRPCHAPSPSTTISPSTTTISANSSIHK
ncbi:unnamed protein product [Adineta steineri]|uniref:Uncharacterized protein n=1 Tax=Adineta steineri TaxID=433720 RepID=A0A814EEZ9_9BILA|nr:unnamed protein product [Adineta steineri]CAF1038672.1 unnamed protein product [Adineta steineri]